MQNPQKLVTINSRKLGGKISRSWQAELIEQNDSLLVFVGVFEDEVRHPNLGVIRRGTVSYEYYWLDRWYNVFRFHEPEGGLRNFYCNLNLPPTFQKNVLDYVDLDIDVLVWSDFSFEILDLEDFEESASIYDYSDALRRETQKNLDELLEMIKMRIFPFDFQTFDSVL